MTMSFFISNKGENDKYKYLWEGYNFLVIQFLELKA